jgi:hypothetical protein
MYSTLQVVFEKYHPSYLKLTGRCDNLFITIKKVADFLPISSFSKAFDDYFLGKLYLFIFVI